MARPPRFPTGEVVRIAILVVLLAAVVVMKRRCGKAAENLFRAFDQPVADGGNVHD
jgi:hypothetical protein